MKKFVICLLAFLICGCRNTIDFDFDTYKQSFHISNGYFYDLCFENDSVLPNGYIVSRGGIPSSERKIKLKANSTYTISSTGLGAVECRIKAWTNRNGKILKAVKY